jgi:hypothetical protein
MQYRRLISLIFVLSLTTGAHATDTVTWPVTVDEAVHDLMSKLSTVDKLDIRWTAEKNLISSISAWDLPFVINTVSGRAMTNSFYRLAGDHVTQTTRL